MAGILLDSLTKLYDTTYVVDHVSLEIRNGEFFVFVGPSGSGKSTILRLLAGLIPPVSGDIKFNGKSVAGLDPRDRNVAMVFQNYALYPHKKVYDNIAFGLRARKIPEEEVDSRVHEAAGLLDIERLLNRWPKELSGGERQRVAIGRAIVRKPEVYLLDEPLSNLDARLRIDMRNEIANLHSRLGTTFIYVTHDQTEAMTLGDRIAVINHGKIEQVDTPEDLYDFPVNQFVASFIGSPSMNFIKGTMAHNEKDKTLAIEMPEGLIKLEGALEENLSVSSGAEVILGIRPEAIRLEKARELSTNGEVERVEPIGHEGFIYLTVLGTTIIVRVRNWKRYKDSETIALTMNIENVYLFLPENGRCILGRGHAMNSS
ncbi:MAG: ABC transporter ATP-binding protein [Thermodesulfobacteriota bacterium]